MAAELAKVSLWLEALEPGKPLAFLDAHIRVGNALLGTTPALLAQGIPDEAFTALTGDDKTVVTALRKRNKAEREQLATGHEQLDMFEATGLPVDNTRTRLARQRPAPAGHRIAGRRPLRPAAAARPSRTTPAAGTPN